MTGEARGAVEMTAAMTISGTIGWFVVVSGQPVTDVVFWRCAFGAAALLAVCAAMGLLRRGVMTPRQALIAAAGGLAIVLNWLLLFAAYSRATISIATVVYNTQPFMLVGLGMLFLGERPTPAKLAWLGLAFAGVVLLVQAGTQADTAGGYILGIAMALGAALLYAVAAILAKLLKGVPTHLITLIQVLVGLLVLAPFARLSALPDGAGTWSILATLGIVHTGLMFTLLYSAIQRLPTTLTGALSFIYPLVAIAVDLLAFGHRLDGAQLVGAAMILVAAAGATLRWSPLRRRRVLANASAE